MLKQTSLALLSVLMVAGSFAVAPESHGAGTSAIITHTLGTVQMRTRSGWRGTRRNVRLWPGTTLRTGSRSRVQVRYKDGSVVRLGSRSLMRVRPSRNFRLMRGKSWIRKKKSSKRMRIRTPMAQATVVGTELFVSHNDKDISHVTTLTGLVEVENNKGEKVMVKAGQWVEIEPDKALEQPTPFDWNKLKKKERLLLDLDFVPPADAPEETDEDWM